MNPTVALSMIVRNGGEDLARCLTSVRGIVDEIVIADTGSEDLSIALAENFGARVIGIPWQDDFAAARNASLREAKSDWILVLDADEQLDDKARAQVPAALHNPGVDGYQVTIRNYVLGMDERLWDQAAISNDGRLSRADVFEGYLPHQNVRLFRNNPEFCFEGRVHETVGARIESVGGRLGQAEFIIHHFGFTAAPDQRAAKNILYRELGRRKVKEMPRSAQAHFELGLVEFDNFHNDAEALRLFIRACELNERMAVAWFFRGMALARLSRHAEAPACFQRARQCGGDVAQCRQVEGDAFYNCRQFDQARRAYIRAGKQSRSREVLSKLGLTEIRLGHVEPGLKKMRAAIENSRSPQLFDRLITGLVNVGRIAEAAAVSEEKLTSTGFSQPAFLRTVTLWVYAKQPERALRTVMTALEKFPGSVELQGIHRQLTQLGDNTMVAQGGAGGLKISEPSPIGTENKLSPEPKSADPAIANRTSEKEYQHVSQHTQ